MRPEHQYQPAHPEGGSGAERITLRRRFVLFPPELTATIPREPGWGFRDLPRYESVRLVETGVLPPLPVRFVATPTFPASDNALTPFQPDAGYQVTPEDFLADARRAKVEDLFLTRRVRCPIPEAPLRFAAYVDYAACAVAGLLRDTDGEGPLPFRAEVLSDIATLQLHVFFPSADTQVSVAAQPTPEWLEHGEIAFTRFYPLDFGHLAPSTQYPERLVLREGLDVAVPNHPDTLATITARFSRARPE